MYFSNISIYVIFPAGSFKNLKRNNVKLHDNILKLMQEREEDKRARDIQMELIRDLRDEVKLLVSLQSKQIIIK